MDDSSYPKDPNDLAGDVPVEGNDVLPPLGSEAREEVGSDNSGLPVMAESQMPHADTSPKVNASSPQDYSDPVVPAQPMTAPAPVVSEQFEESPASVPVVAKKGLNTKMVAGIAVVAALIVGVPAVAFSLGVFRGDVRQRASEPVVVVPEQQAVEGQGKMVVAEEAVVEEATTTVVTDVTDTNWLNYRPKDVTAKYVGDQSVEVSWTDDVSITPRPHLWVVGYWSSSFDAVEKFNFEKLPQSEWIQWDGVDVDTTKKTVVLDTSVLPESQDGVFYYIYVRTKQGDMQLLDYVYGVGGINNVAFNITR